MDDKECLYCGKWFDPSDSGFDWYCCEDHYEADDEDSFDGDDSPDEDEGWDEFGR